MNLRKLFFWFWTTLLIGGVAAFAFSLALRPWLGALPWLDVLLMGLTFATVSMLGLFSYLIFQWLATGLLRTAKRYHVLLIVLLIVILLNLIYLNMSQFQDQPLWIHFSIPLVVLIVAAIVTVFKVRWTNKQALIPTFFFMVVVTILEVIPSLNPKDGQLPVVTIYFTIIILLLCNAWQILQLHRLVNKKE
jgi:KinB signaling pathway activation protein